jgi:NADH dehydrogenase
MSHRIVIVGGGAGGLELATRLGRSLGKCGRAEIVLVDERLTHVWKPLLHEVAAGSLDTARNEINYVAQAKRCHFQFQLGRLCSVNRSARTIELATVSHEDSEDAIRTRQLWFDTLVLAVGSVTNDFNTKGAAEHCTFLDTPTDASRFHRQLLGRYLAAHADENESARLEVAIIGAGATGVELAAEMRNSSLELAAYGLGNIRPENMRITLLDAGPRVLPALPEHIGLNAQTTLEKLGVTVMTSAPVTEVTADGLTTADGKEIAATLKVWAAGIKAPSFLKDLDGLDCNRMNQLLVRPTLQTIDDDNIFAIGDCAACPRGDGSGKMVPPRAQAAHQQAALLARSMKLRIQRKALPEYRYRDYGSLVSLSRFSAVGNLMGSLRRSVNVEGWLARLFYVSLYRMHQVAVIGLVRTGLSLLRDRIDRETEPRLKLH